MNRFAFFVSALCALALQACASTATMQTAAAVTSFAVEQDPIPGNWAVVVQASEIPTRYTSGEFTCSGWTYTVESEESFRESVLATMDAAFENIQPMNTAPSRSAIQSQQLDGTVIVSVNTYNAFMSWLQGFWSAQARAEATIRIGVEVRDRDGERIAGFSEGAQRSSTAESGGCDAGSTAIARALAITTQSIMESALERIQDNPRIRQAVQRDAS